MELGSRLEYHERSAIGSLTTWSEVMTEMTPESNVADVVVPEGVREARAAFLPALFADPKIRGKFVVYRQDRRVAVARTYRSNIDQGNRLNLPDGAYLVLEVSPDSEAWERVVALEGELDPT